MASALECWSSRTSTDEDMVDQVLMKTQDRSEAVPVDSAARPSKESSVVQKKLQKLSRNVAEAITTVKNSLNLDSVREPPATKPEDSRELLWCGVVRNLTQLYPGSQLPEKLVSNIRKHFDSLPIRYAQAGFDMKEVFLHIKLIEQAEVDDYPAILIQELAEEDTQRCTLKLTFACNSSISWLNLSEALDKVVICCKKIQIFENKGFTLGVILVLVQSGQEKQFKIKIESALKSALKKPKPATVMLSFGLCGCQEENSRGREIVETDDEKDEQNYGIGVTNSNPKFQLPNPLPESSYIVSVDEWQTIRSGGDEIGKWLLNSDQIEFLDQLGPTTFKGIHKGKRVSIERIKGCEKGCSYEFQVRRDLLELMICGHRNILEFHGVCIEETHGLCVVTKMKEGGSVQEIIQKNKKLQTREVIRIAIDVAEGMKFMNDHGVAYRDLNSQKILLDGQGHACLGDMGLVTACKSIGEAMDYETDGHRWLAPEIIAGDPESVTETWMSNVYSFGMVVWEMVTGEAAYAAYSPVQAAVGIAACGLRPEIPKDCPQLLRSLMMKCWNDCPSKRPQLSEILGILMRANSANTSTNTNHR